MAGQPDWTREQKKDLFSEPWKTVVFCMRMYQRARNSWLFPFIKPFILVIHKLFSVICGLDIPINSQIGGGMLMVHPNGIVIHPDAVIGMNCLIFQQVTIGTGSRPGVPRIGHHVEIGAGAKILGGISVGDGARIGANAVVVQDVPADATAVGVPARVLRKVQV